MGLADCVTNLSKSSFQTTEFINKQLISKYVKNVIYANICHDANSDIKSFTFVAAGIQHDDIIDISLP